MPRRCRLVYDNAIYHVINRGHNKYKLFRKQGDFKMFKDIIRKYKESYPFELYHYVFMSNHFHLLFKIKRADALSKIMKGICQSFANYYKKSYNHVGYLFQNRYKSIHIQKDSHLLECARYIERNPLRAGAVENISNYFWSSYNFYANAASDEIITENPLYETFGTDIRQRQQAYKEYVSTSRPYEELLDDAIVSLK